MADLHSHPHYEIYFLLDGERDVFLPNRLCHVKSPSVLVIPPYVLHKTEGGGYLRININVSEDYLSDYEAAVLSRFSEAVICLGDAEAGVFPTLLRELLQISKYAPNGPEQQHILFSYLIYRMDQIKESQIREDTVVSGGGVQSVIALKTLSYLNEHFTEKITLDTLAVRLYVSKPTILHHFRRYTGCTVGDYLLNLRLSHAKQMLAATNKSIGEIAEACGFSSPNYFGIIFRRKENLSPLAYRKYQKTIP